MKQPELGQKILQLRQQKGFTQEELVEQCNISVRTIQRIEAGEVTPRSFTIKTILEALEFPLEEFQETKAESTFKNLLLLKIDNSKQATFFTKQLTIAWISGIVFFVIGFIEFPADFARLYEDEMLFSTPVYSIIKLISLVSLLLFLRGFVLLGTIFKNYFLKIVAFIFISVNVMFYVFDFVSLFVDISDNYESILMAESLTYGIVGVLMGIAVIRLNKIMGNIAMVTGIFEIVTYALFATVVLAIGGFILLIPTLILEIILLYKAMQMIKEKQKELA